MHRMLAWRCCIRGWGLGTRLLLHDLHLQEGQGTNIGYASKNYGVAWFPQCLAVIVSSPCRRAGELLRHHSCRIGYCIYSLSFGFKGCAMALQCTLFGSHNRRKVLIVVDLTWYTVMDTSWTQDMCYLAIMILCMSLNTADLCQTRPHLFLVIGFLFFCCIGRQAGYWQYLQDLDHHSHSLYKCT